MFLSPQISHTIANLMTTQQQSKSLELIYVQCARKNDLLFQEEDARQLRLRILLLEDENDDLHDQLAQEDDRIDLLEKEKEELQERVTEALRDLKLAQTEVRAKGRELDTIKVFTKLAA
jgi:predicted  nucleic acid-binding Zn-ribbon protein